jgi:O-acetyl-ADP-ribose deacetylase (regulator of RNase III)
MVDLTNPWIITIIGGAIATIIAGLALYYFRRFEEYRRINKKATVQKGIVLKFNNLSIDIKEGEIQNIGTVNRNSAVILPANTTFIDDCITDAKSALGAFFLKHYSDKIPQKVSEDIEKALENFGYKKDEDGSYPPGTTIILPKEYNTPAKCIIAASTIRKEKVGIMAYPSTICECIRQIFEITADKKVERIYMPVIGSGHGGLDMNDALLFILLNLKYYSKRYHHIKSVEILVTPEDALKLKDAYRLQYLSLLEAKEK